MDYVGWGGFVTMLLIQHVLYLLWDLLVAQALRREETTREYWNDFVLIDVLMILISLALFFVSYFVVPDIAASEDPVAEGLGRAR